MELGIERDRRTRNRGAVLVTERRVTQRKRGLEPHPEMAESKEVYSLRGGGDLFFFFFLTWRWLTSVSYFSGRGLGTVSIDSRT
ncbi:unnamed protein product [Sphagnum jensenii]|uniref:Uncharacterized protein n=1 Tax=Sphagnum jensenii TaxID=128206 RepID=A0ABP0WDT3_9BRYO